MVAALLPWVTLPAIPVHPLHLLGEQIVDERPIA
jgi:hypothetical protein